MEIISYLKYTNEIIMKSSLPFYSFSPFFLLPFSIPPFHNNSIFLGKMQSKIVRLLPVIIYFIFYSELNQSAIIPR